MSLSPSGRSSDRGGPGPLAGGASVQPGDPSDPGFHRGKSRRSTGREGAASIPGLRFAPRYLKYTLDQHVASDYAIVYFHCGLSSQNKPSLSWLQDAYQEFDRKCVPASPPVLEWTPGRGPGRGRGAARGSRQCSGQGRDTRARARRASDRAWH